MPVLVNPTGQGADVIKVYRPSDPWINEKTLGPAAGVEAYHRGCFSCVLTSTRPRGRSSLAAV